MLKFPCPHCGHLLKAAEQHLGRRVRCTRCAGELTVTGQHDEPAQPGELAQHDEPDPHDKPALPASRALGLATEPPSEPFSFQPAALDDDDDTLDMTSMIDVVFQLLIFFMLTAAIGLQKSLEIPPPESQSSAGRSVQQWEQDPSCLIVRIDADNTVWVDEALAPTAHELRAKLRAARAPNATAARGPNRMLVLASGDAHHERVVMALDAGSAVGMEEVRLSMIEDD